MVDIEIHYIWGKKVLVLTIWFSKVVEMKRIKKCNVLSTILSYELSAVQRTRKKLIDPQCFAQGGVDFVLFRSLFNDSLVENGHFALTCCIDTDWKNFLPTRVRRSAELVSLCDADGRW